MIPDAFASKYPHIAAMLMAIKSKEPITDSASSTVETAVADELSAVCRDEKAFVELLSGLFGGPPRPDEEFLRVSLTAYRRFHASEASRMFMGRIWADAVCAWSSKDRAIFLSALLRDPYDVFETLDIAVHVFEHVQFTFEEVFPWISEAHGRVVNDMYQKGFWGCIKAFCRTSPQAAVIVAGHWLDARPEGPSLTVVSNMIGWLRIAERAHPELASDFVALEERLKASGYPAWRALYIQSWAANSGSHSLTESVALELRDRFVCADADEETAWCFLLSSVVDSQPASCPWAHRELRAVARPSLGEASKYWVAAAALHGIESAQQGDAVPAAAWLELFRALLPIAASSGGLWQRVHETLSLLADRDSHAMRELVGIIATHSARSWLQILNAKASARFFQILKQKGLAGAVSADLCFTSGARLRELGLMVFDKCSLHELDAAIVRNASSTQVELLLLEAQRRPIGYGAVARLHACLAERVDEIGETLPELFYEEVSRQCFNTHEYRVALAGARPGHEYLQAIVTDVGERLSVISKALRSPALLMLVPGQKRAQTLHDRRVVQEVSKNIKQHSTFLNLFPSIHMLYGGLEPRIYLREGALTPPMQMHSSSSSVEVPRLEFLDPEGMCLRRLAATVRVAELESVAANRDDDQ
jgi:hypothetical protein